MSKSGKIAGLVLIAVCVFAAGYFLHGWLGGPGSDKSPNSIATAPLAPQALTRETVIESTNAERQAHGLQPLTENELLNKIAEGRARDLLAKQYFDHVSPTGEQASDVAQHIGYAYKIIAENLAQGFFPTGKKMVDGWMQSPSHRKNLLNPEVKEIGISILKGKMNGQETTVAVQILGLESPPVSARICPKPSESLAQEIEARKAEIDGLRERLTQLKEELDAERQAIETEKSAVRSDSQETFNLNVKIKTYNEKSQWHNQIIADINAKTAVLQKMIDEYNQAVRAYKRCLNEERHE
jgi:hypothetical protein